MPTEPPKADPPKADPPKRQRRWFQFSLRTLMICVTLLAIGGGYIGRQYETVRARKLFADAQRDFVTDTSVQVEIPWIRKLLGDEGIWKIGLDPEMDKTERLRAAALFPEAQILTIALRRHPEISLDNFTIELVPFDDDLSAQPIQH